MTTENSTRLVPDLGRDRKSPVKTVDIIDSSRTLGLAANSKGSDTLRAVHAAERAARHLDLALALVRRAVEQLQLAKRDDLARDGLRFKDEIVECLAWSRREKLEAVQDFDADDYARPAGAP